MLLHVARRAGWLVNTGVPVFRALVPRCRGEPGVGGIVSLEFCVVGTADECAHLELGVGSLAPQDQGGAGSLLP